MAQSDRKKSQFIALGVLGGVVVLLFVFMVMFMGPPATPQLPGTKQATVDETVIRDRNSGSSPEMTWVTQGRVQMERLSKELEEQRKLLEETRRVAERRANDIQTEYDDLLLQQAQKIEELEQALSEARSAPQSPGQPLPSGREQLETITTNKAGTDFISKRPAGTRTRVSNSNGTAAASQAVAAGNFGQTFTLVSAEGDRDGKRDVRKLTNYLPAGSYAPAIVLSGADAATNVSNRENPIPVLFRLTGPAITAAVGGRAPARVNLKGCTVQGSATGDLSAERVKVRLITMTCINKRGDVLETKVSGYMVGSGKEGVRGHVTSREGGLTRSAMMAGLVSGLGSGFNGAANAQLGVETANTQQILKGAAVGSLGSGLESAASALSEYYIDRAEQYQPVVSLYGGTEVELVFLEGVELGQ